MILIGGKAYELITDHKNGWNQEVFRERYNEVLDRYDYIVGDWGYSQLRLRGFFKENSPRATKESSIAVLQDYLNEYCNFGCAYFIIERVPSKNQGEGESELFADEASLREETTAGQEDMPKYTIRSQPAPERAPRPQHNPASQGDRQGSGQGQQGGRPQNNRGGGAQGQQGQRSQGQGQTGKPQGQQGGRPPVTQRDQGNQLQQGTRPNQSGQPQGQRAQLSSQSQGQGQQQGGGTNQQGNKQYQGQRPRDQRQQGQQGQKQYNGQQGKQQASPNSTSRPS